MKVYDYRGISDDGRTWINDLRKGDSFPADIDPAKMSEADRDQLAAYLRDEDPSLSDAGNEFSAGVADEIDGLAGIGECAGETLTVGRYKSRVNDCAGEIEDAAGDVLADAARITISDDGLQYCVGEYDGNQTWIDLY